tara:strand:- start:710 stop:1471 length:762 start_codon:yes stop_codon:yes gene_type:complete
MEKQLIVVIMAGGNGKRMESNKNSHAVIEEVGEVPMVARVVNQAARLIPRKLIVVVNENELKVRAELRKHAIEDDIEYINQGPSLGTGYAINMCRHKLKKYNNAQTLIVPANMPLVTTKIMSEIVKKSGDIKIPYIKKENAGDMDRIKIVKGKFSKIITREECCAKDLTNENVCIGMYCIDNMLLCSNVQFIQSYCNSNEEHIEEVINIIKKREQVDINTLKIQLIQHIKVKRIRTPEDLKDINNYVDALSLI